MSFHILYLCSLCWIIHLLSFVQLCLLNQLGLPSLWAGCLTNLLRSMPTSFGNFCPAGNRIVDMIHLHFHPAVLLPFSLHFWNEYSILQFNSVLFLHNLTLLPAQLVRRPIHEYIFTSNLWTHLFNTVWTPRLLLHIWRRWTVLMTLCSLQPSNLTLIISQRVNILSAAVTFDGSIQQATMIHGP